MGEAVATIVKNIYYGRHWKRSSIWSHPLVRLGREITWPDMTSRFVRQIEGGVTEVQQKPLRLMVMVCG